MGELKHADNENKFPLSFFPSELQNIIIEVAHTYSYPIEYVCCSVLVASSTAIGNSNSIQIKTNWIERPSIFMALIGSPGVNKSAPLTWAMMPIEKQEKELYKKYLSDIKEYDQSADKLNKPEPKLIKTVISDATPEAVVQQLQLNDRGILVLMDELAGFLNTFQRYSKGNDEQFYLSVWSGKSVIVDRKTARSIRINDPVVNIIGTIQPGVLDKSFTGKDESGFFDRWLLCYPKNAKKEYWNDQELNHLSQSKYERIINNLSLMLPTEDQYQNITSAKLMYNSKALIELKSWQRKNTDYVNNGADDISKAIRSKIETYIHRFALICELINSACESFQVRPPDISLTAVEESIKLCEYFINNAIEIRTGDKTEKLPENFKNLIDLIPIDKEFTYQQFLEIAEHAEIVESTARKWLKRNTGKDQLFYKIRHGIYGRQ